MNILVKEISLARVKKEVGTHFIFSITYSDVQDSVKSEVSDGVNMGTDRVNLSEGSVKNRKDSVNTEIIATIEPVQLDDEKLEEALIALVGVLKVSRAIRKRMVQELKHIYRSDKIDRASIMNSLGYTASQMKGDLHLLAQEGLIIFSAKERTYSLSIDALSKINS